MTTKVTKRATTRAKHTLLKAKAVQEIVKEWYEPERQDRCKLWVFRNKVSPIYQISERTFFAYLALDTSKVLN